MPQVDADPPEEDPMVADILFVRPDGRIERQEFDIDPRLTQRSGEGVVVHATAAVHTGGAGGQIDDTGRVGHADEPIGRVESR